MQIDVFHDIACPWCRIGKAHLKQALQNWHGEPVEVSYRAYFLNPDIPVEGYEFAPYMTAKGGGRVPMEQWFAQPRDAGERAGVVFNFDRIEKAPKHDEVTSGHYDYTGSRPRARDRCYVRRVLSVSAAISVSIDVIEQIITELGLDGAGLS